MSELLANSQNFHGDAPTQVKVSVKSRVEVLETERVKKEAIWKDNELARAPQPVENDSRKRPRVEILHRQNLGAEDFFLNLGDKDASTDHCDSLLVRVYMPGSSACDISLDVRDDSLTVQSAEYFLSLPLPSPVKKDQGLAKWDKSKSELAITLQIAVSVRYVKDPREAYFEN